MTGDRSVAADTLRDELAEALHEHDADDPWDDAGCNEEWMPGRSCKKTYQDRADAVLPKALAYADAQVAAEREHIAADHFTPNDETTVNALAEVLRSSREQGLRSSLSWREFYKAEARDALAWMVARIARGQP